MREILFLLLLCTLFEQCLCTAPLPSPMKPILTKDSDHDKFMAFLARKKCGDPNLQKTDVGFNELVSPEKFTVQEMYEKNHCEDTIGFLPISDKKVQIFVTTATDYGTIKNSKGETVARKLTNIELSYEDPSNEILVIECDPKTGKITSKSPAGSEVVPVSERLLKPEPSLFQCDSFYLESDGVKLEDVVKYDWILKITLEPDQGSTETLKYKGKINKPSVPNFKLFDRKRCDPDKLKLPNKKSTTEITYEKLERKSFQADNDLGNYVPDDQGIYTKQDAFLKSSVQCARDFIVKVNNEDPVKLNAAYLKCEKDSNDVWHYVAKTSINAPTIERTFAIGDTIEVECLTYECTQCKAPAHAACEADIGDCSGFNTKTTSYKECSTLELPTGFDCGENVLRINNERYEKFETLPDIKCDADKQFKLNGEPITDLLCNRRFSLTVGMQNHDPATTNGTALSDNKPEAPLQCDDLITGCVCRLEQRLAIANADKTSWLRIESLLFDNTTGNWKYDRKHKDGLKTHVLDHKTKQDRAFACVDEPIDPRTEAQLAGMKKNPKKSIVFAVNVILLAVLMGVTIPAVIFYVNARIKKREARKAAKKDKKKEEQSGEKKDGEAKKDEEKKNEA